MLLDELQEEMREWEQERFPNRTQLHRGLVLSEETGEAAHHIIKRYDGPRIPEDNTAGLRDAVGDIGIILLIICEDEGWSFEEILKETWEQVKHRRRYEHE